MDISQIKEFFMWMTVLNMGIMILQAVLCMGIKDAIGRMHGRMFGIAPDILRAVLYGYLGVYKVFLIVFCLTPWIALEIMS